MSEIPRLQRISDKEGSDRGWEKDDSSALQEKPSTGTRNSNLPAETWFSAAGAKATPPAKRLLYDTE